MGFRNSILAGLTLVREAIRSENYVAGSSGWTINQDGSAEFNNITIRGGTTTQGTILLYSGTPAAGNLFGSFARTSGTDEFGNAYPAGLQVQNAANGTYTRMSTGSSVQINDEDDWDNPASVSVTQPFASFQFATMLQSAFNDSAPYDEPAALMLEPGDSTPARNATVRLEAPFSSVAVDMELTGQITEYDENAFTTYTPTIGNDGTATYSNRIGWYQRFGKMIFFNAYAVASGAGSGASNVTITAPTSIDRTTRQRVGASLEAMTAGNSGSGSAVAFTTGSGATFDRIRNSTGGNITGADITATSIIAVEGWYREA